MKTMLAILGLVLVVFGVGALYGPKPHDSLYRVKGEPQIVSVGDWIPSWPWATPTPRPSMPQAHSRPHIRMSMNQEAYALMKAESLEEMNALGRAGELPPPMHGNDPATHLAHQYAR
jgi:hypothetical protein